MSKYKLLLADDSITIQKVVNLTFADEGIEVITVGDGDSAWQKINESAPDLIMADVNMPGLSGYQICEKLKQNQKMKNIPLILLVGSFEPFDETEAQRVGADDFMTKPFQSIRQLVGKVSDLLGRKNADSEGEETAQNPAVEQIGSFQKPTNAQEFVNALPNLDENISSAPNFSDGDDSDDEMIQTSQSSYSTAKSGDFNQIFQNDTKDFEINSNFNSYRTVNDFEAEKTDEFSTGNFASEKNETSNYEIEKPEYVSETADDEKTENRVPAIYDFDDSGEGDEQNIDEKHQEVIDNQRFNAPELKTDNLKSSAEEIPVPAAAKALEDDEFDLLELPPLETSEPEVKVEKKPASPPIAETIETEITAASSENANNAPQFHSGISPEMIEAIAQRVVEKLSEKFFDKEV